MFTIKNSVDDYKLMLITDINGVTEEVLKEHVDKINIGEHHTIVAIFGKTSLSKLAMVKDTVDVSNFVPVVAKSNLYNVGDKIIIDATSLERGTHLYLNHPLDVNFIKRFIERDKHLLRNIVTNNITEEIVETSDKVVTAGTEIWVMSFKIVPNNDIKATIPKDYVGSQFGLVYNK